MKLGDVVLARVAAALEAVHAHRVAADRLGLERMADRRALVDHLDPGGFQRRQVRLRVPARGLDDPDPALDDRPDVLGIGRRRECREEGEVHGERPVGHLAAAGNLAGQRLRRLLRQPGDDPPGRRRWRPPRQLGEADKVHPALDDRVLDAKQLGDAGLHGPDAIVRWQPLRGIPWARPPHVSAPFFRALRRAMGRKRRTGRPNPYLFVLWWHCGYPASDERCAKGWQALNDEVGVTPEAILAIPSANLARALEAGGMVPDLRAARLKEIASRIEHDHGSFTRQPRWRYRRRQGI